MKEKWHQDILLKWHLLLRMSIDTAPVQPITLPLPNLIIFSYNFSPCSTVHVCSFPWLLFSPIHSTHQLRKNVSSIKTGTIFWSMCLILIFYWVWHARILSNTIKYLWMNDRHIWDSLCFLIYTHFWTLIYESVTIVLFLVS